MSEADSRVIVMALSMSDRQEFLAQPHVAALSVAGRTGRGPLTVPIWYYFVPGHQPWVLTRPESRKAILIAAAGRFTLLVHRSAPTVRYVSVEGPVIETGPATEDHIRMMACRYLPAERVESYVEFARHEHIIRIRAEHWLSSDLGPL